MYTGMEELKLERPVEMLLALLRAALHGREPEAACFCRSTPAEWLQCYRLAVRQGVAPLAWGAVERVQAECAPPLEVKLSWAMFEERQQEKYHAHCCAAAELTRLYAEHGIAVVVLKGIGLSRLYPVPERREGGDVDIYTFSADRARMTDEEANCLANELMEQQGIEVDYSYAKVHTSFFFKGVRFENHRRFLSADAFTTADKVDAWLKEHIAPQPVSLHDGLFGINVPSASFDNVFIPLHAAHHYGKGLSLRHLCDWVILALNGKDPAHEEPDNECLHRVAGALSLLCNRHLGTQIPADGADGKLASEVMEEIIAPPFGRRNKHGNPIKACIYKTRHKLHLLWLKHRLLGISPHKSALRLLLSVLSHPTRLYK
jgi:hypothetical protein